PRCRSPALMPTASSASRKAVSCCNLRETPSTKPPTRRSTARPRLRCPAKNAMISREAGIMELSTRHPLKPDVSFDGGDLDCGNGLLLLIRKHIDPMRRGQLLEIRSTEISVDEDLPAWCRLTGNELVSKTKEGKQRSFLVCKGGLSERVEAEAKPAAARAA